MSSNLEQPHDLDISCHDIQVINRAPEMMQWVSL